MKFITYTNAQGRHAGVLDEDRVYAIPGASSLLDVIGEGLDALLARGRAALKGSASVPLESVRVGAPVIPPAMRDSMCFHEHIRNCMGEVDPLHEQFPTFYLTNAAAVLGPADKARISPGSERFDYELEVGAVIGLPAANVRRQDASRHIIGYTTYIDWSARDLQMEEMTLRLGPAKGKDGATSLGPALVSADAFEPLRKGKGFDIGMSVAINGEPISTGNWSTINWSFDDVVAYTSRGTRLATGEVLGSGTVGGGCLLEHFVVAPDTFRGWLRPGDVVTFEVDLIGRMDITVAEPLERHPLSSGH